MREAWKNITCVPFLKMYQITNWKVSYEVISYHLDKFFIIFRKKIDVFP
jgi:hypothetical protein